MSIHNVLALQAARSLVHLVNSQPTWKQVFTGPSVSLQYVRSGILWPLPDAVLVDSPPGHAERRCALEYKPPQSSKSECVRGLGQATTYLTDFDCAAMIVPDQADDGYPIAEYIGKLLSSAATEQKRIGVYSYSAKLTSSAAILPVDLSLL